jgi:4-hydroxybenzoate polyprenyltransferase
MQKRIDNIKRVISLTRAKDWRLSFIPLIFGNLYLWLILFKISFDFKILLILFLSLTTSFGFAAMGYFINEFFDKKDDMIAGKINKLQLLNFNKQIILFASILLITFIPWVYIPNNGISIALILLQIVFFIIYAAPPFRLKNNCYFSGFIDSMYAYTIPLLLSYYTFFLVSGNSSFSWDIILTYSLLLFITGYRNITIHYINDIFKDKRVGLITLPRHIGIKRTDILLKICLILEAILLFIFILLIGHKQNITYLLIFPFGYIVYKGLNQYFTLKNKIIITDSIRHLPDNFFQYFFPISILVLLIFYNSFWIVFLPIHLFLFVPFFRYQPIISLWNRIHFKHYYYYIYHHYIQYVRMVLSWILNYSIYFLFLIIGVDLKKRNISAITYIKQKIKLY